MKELTKAILVSSFALAAAAICGFKRVSNVLVACGEYERVRNVWVDDETIVCKNRISERKYGMLAISAKTVEVREAKASEFKEAWRSGVRLRGPLRIKERF